MASPIPVLPEVGSTIVPPGSSTPLRSASSTIDRAILSLMEPPGLARSDLIQTSWSLPNRRLMRTCGVLPIVSRIEFAFIRVLQSMGRPDLSGALADDLTKAESGAGDPSVQSRPACAGTTASYRLPLPLAASGGRDVPKPPAVSTLVSHGPARLDQRPR